MEWPAKGQLRLHAPDRPVQSGWWNREDGAARHPNGDITIHESI